MNIKRIAFTAKTYLQSADEGTRGRIALFQPVWQAQADACEAAARALDTAGWQTPDAADLERWYWAGAPFLAQAPVAVDGAALAQAARRIAEALTGTGALDAGVAAALAACDWDALVAATPLATAGTDPAAYLDGSCAAAVDTCGEERAATALLVLSLALRTQLDAAAQRMTEAVRPRIDADREHVKPRTCPVCGGEATLAHVGPTETNKANGRTLWCSQCGATWEYDRVRCVRCGTHDQEKLHYKSIDGDDTHRLHTCDACHGYVRSHFTLDSNLLPFAPEVEDAVMANLDAVAASLGLTAGATR